MIQIEIVDATIGDEGIALTIMANNGTDSVQFGLTFATTLTALQIKTKIDADVTLLFQALAAKTWTLP